MYTPFVCACSACILLVLHSSQVNTYIGEETIFRWGGGGGGASQVIVCVIIMWRIIKNVARKSVYMHGGGGGWALGGMVSQDPISTTYDMYYSEYSHYTHKLVMYTFESVVYS